MDFTPKLEQIRRNTSQIHNLLRDARLVACFGNRALLSLFVGGLIDQNHLVGAATCEAAGLALVEQHQPTMVFLSDTLEQGSGVALVQAIKQRWPTIHTLLLISQEQRQDAIQAAIEAGCDGLLVESRLGLGSAIAALHATNAAQQATNAAQQATNAAQQAAVTRLEATIARQQEALARVEELTRGQVWMCLHVCLCTH